MASVFKRSRWVDAQGQPCAKGTPGATWKKSRFWTVKVYIDGKPKLVKGYKDRQATEQLAAKLERSKAQGEQGLLDPYLPHRVRPLSEHIADWTAELRELGRDDMYVAPCKARVERLMKECGWAKLGDINADAFCKWRQTAVIIQTDGARRAVRTKRLLSPAAKNHYLATLGTFCRWCVKRKRIAANPVADVEKVDETADVRRERRALSAEELERLLDVVPAKYRLAYQMLIGTGLRRTELRAVRWGDVMLNVPRPYIQLQAKDTKSKRADVLPLRADLAELLRIVKDDAKDRERVVKVLPRIPTHKRFLAKAGIPWLDDRGRRADIHALRHSYGTLLSKGGVSPREAMSLMRHTDLRLTMKVYTDPRIFDLAGAVEKLPIQLVKPEELQPQQSSEPDGQSADPESSDDDGNQAPGDGNSRCADGAMRTQCVTYPPTVIGDCSAGIGKTQESPNISETLALTGIGNKKTRPAGTGKKAGDGIRTHDVSLGKAAFYH